MKHLKNNLILLLAAFIWGCAFVAQSVSMDYIKPFTFNATRTIIGGIVLLPVIFVMERARKKSVSAADSSDASENSSVPNADSSVPVTSGGWNNKSLWIGGILCGICLCVASNLQQFGICYTTVGKAGFITALYIVLVPIIGIFLGKKVRALVWVSVLMSAAGLYLLCITDSFSLGKGDILLLLCALVFSCHILVIDHFSPMVDCVKMSCIQFFTCGIISAVPMLLLERPEPAAILAAWIPVLYAGVMSCGVAYTLQIAGQKNADPTVASLLLSLESVFSVLAGWVILKQSLTLKELAGCALMFAAIVLAQLPQKRNGR